MTQEERQAVDEAAEVQANKLRLYTSKYDFSRGFIAGAQFLSDLRKPSEHKTNVGDDFTNDKIIFGTLPDGTNVITVIGKNIRNESYIRQQVGVHSSVFDVLKKKIESKPSEPETNVGEAGEELVERLRQTAVSCWVAFDCNKTETYPTKYGKYLICRKDGKIHWETWNGGGWAYNHSEIRFWAVIAPPCC